MANRTNIDTRIAGTLRSHIVEEFFTNSGHFPMALVFFELLVDGWAHYLVKPDAYFTLGTGLLQAFYLGWAKFRGKSFPLFGNLIAPILYTSIELMLEGAEFFESPHHIAFWVVAITVGLMQSLQMHAHPPLRDLFLLIENIARTSIVLIMYWAFEAISTPNAYDTLPTFFSDPSHRFIAVVIPLTGIFIGLSQIAARRYLSLLRETAGQLRTYSEWFFGRDLLSHAVANPDAVTLQRRRRAVMFMDIRGFTQWSESRPPEEVVGMLNAYFSAAERIWTGFNPIKVKFTADEIMLIFPDALTAVNASQALAAEAARILEKYRLAAGIGVHVGPLVEGLLGSDSVRGYDVIGDTVNTGKRLCDAAFGSEILLSDEVYEEVRHLDLPIIQRREITVKGKGRSMSVHVLCADTHDFITSA